MERQIGCAFFFVVVLQLVNAGTVNINHPVLSSYVNQTSTGYYREVWGTTETLRIPTTWYQDDVTKRARADTGLPGQSTWESTWYFFADKSYMVEPKDGKVSCTLVPDFNYTTEAETYGPKYLSFVGRHTLQEFGANQVADVYAGQVLDTDGPLGTWYYAGPTNTTGQIEDNAFLGMIRIGSIQSNLSFYEIWLDKISYTIPDSSLFDLPHECDHPDATEHFWDKWNVDGTPKQSNSVIP